MPKIKSAKKRVLVAERNRRRNRNWKTAVREARKKVLEVLKSSRSTSIDKPLSEAFSRIDKAVTKGVLHRNTAARRKSRLVALVKKAAGAA